MRRKILLATAILSTSLFVLWGCSSKEAADPAVNSTVSAEVTAESSETTMEPESGSSKAEIADAAKPEIIDENTIDKDSIDKDTAEAVSSNPTDPETEEADSRASSLEESDYKGFVRQIQKAFTDRDMEALAKLCAYPVYVTTEANTEGLDVSDSAGLEAQKDDIFTDVMIQAITAVDPDKLAPSESGVYIGSESGAPGLFFTLSEEGKLCIMAINSEVLE